MSAHSRLRRFAVATAAVTLSPALFAGATASGVDEPPSTPVPIVTPDGLLMSYVLNAKHANHGQMKKVEAAVERAGGVIIQSWSEIGVVVAHSDREAFRSDVQQYARQALESVGATRTVAVSEGTPGVAGSGARHGEQKAEGEVGAEATTAVVPDPREVEQWDMRMIKADQAHEITDGSRDVLVGVLDSGIDPDHPDLVANIDTEESVNCSDAGRLDRSATGWYPTTSDHGTHVAGTIAAARNGIGIVGVAPNVRMASVKVVNDDGFIYPEYAVCGFVWAGLRGMDVTNNSYYVDPFMYFCEDQPDQYAAKEAVRRAVEWSTSQGVVHAAAAGNAANRPLEQHDRQHQPRRQHPDQPHDQQRLRGHPDRARWRCHCLFDAAVPGQQRGEPAVELLQPGPRRDRRGRSRLEHPVDDRQRQRLRPQERYVDGLATRRRRTRSDAVGAPGLVACADDRGAPRPGRRQGLRHHHRRTAVRGPRGGQQLLR